MKFTRALGRVLQTTGVVLGGLVVNQATGAVPDIPAVLPAAALPWVGLAIPVLQALIGQKAFNHNWNGSPASEPAPPEPGKQ